MVQHGLITFRQALDCGLTRAQLSRWAESGRFTPVQPGVYRLEGAPITWEQEVAAAVLSTGGVASHRTAARFWSLGDYPKVELTVTRRGRGRGRVLGEDVVVHSSKDLAPHHVTTRAGIPCTKPMRTLVDLGAVEGIEVVRDSLERAVIAQVCSVPAVERALDDVARKGRRGAGVIRHVLDERALGRARPDGLLEARMARLLREHGLPTPAFQHRVGRYILDFAYVAEKLALEVDGFEVHGTPQALQADLERQNALVKAGWRVLRFTWLDVVRRPEWVAFCIKEALAEQVLAGRSDDLVRH